MKKIYLLSVLFISSFIFADEIGDMEYVLNPKDKTRKINMNVFHESKKEYVPVYEIIDINTGKLLTPRALFSIGVLLELEIKFADYETIEKNITITPGMGVFQITHTRLNPLSGYNLDLYESQKNIDGIDYNAVFSIEDKLIEEHLLTIKKNKKYWECNLKGDRYAKNIRIAIGFFYTDVNTSSRTVNVYSLKNIDIEKYISHLKTTKKSKAELLSIIQRFLKANQSSLKKNSMNDIDKLSDYLYSLNISANEDRIFENVMYELEKIQDRIESY